jgi:hypothetical protein
MPTRPQSPPVAEIQACAEQCAEWLRANGYVITADPPRDPYTGVLFSLDHERIFGVEPASTVSEIYHWLWVDVLPPLNGRRESAGRQLLEHASATIPDRADAADLYFGRFEHDVAAKLRAVSAQAERLHSQIEKVADRQARRAVMKGAETGLRVRRTFARWLELGERLRRLVEPTGSIGLGGLPESPRVSQRLRELGEWKPWHGRASSRQRLAD